MVTDGTTNAGAWHGHARQVTITTVTTVPPALPVQEHRLALSNLDLILPPIDVGVFFCYADPPGPGGSAAAALKVALAKTLVAYYPLAGEVVANAAGEPELLCSGRGVDVAEASADGAELRDVRLGLPDESVEQLVPKKKGGVMSVQVTKFKCGGVVVGCTFDHRVCDAYSFNMFLVAWAAAARGSPAPPSPSFRRSFVAPRQRAPPCTTGTLADRLFVPVSRAAAPPAAAAANRIYRVAAADVAALQASAGPGRTKLESFTAHLWQLYARAASPRQRSCSMGVVVDGRTRLRRDGAMSAYFGNVLTIPYGAIATDALRGMAVADVAGDVHRWVAEAATGDHFRELVDWVEAQRPEPTVARAYLGRDDGGEDAAACVVSSGLRLPVGDVDFGWGRPAFASYHFPWPGGAGYVMPMPSARGDGDWVVYVHAAPEVVEVMEAEPTVFRALESSYMFGMVKEVTKEHDGHDVTVTVAPALPVQGHRLPLSNLDLLLPPLDVSLFFCYLHPAPTAAALKEALAKTLVPYHPLAGEVVANDGGEPELLCSGRGVDFTEATAAGGVELREIRLGAVDEGVEKLVPAKSKASVVAVKVTKFRCGGAVVGCTFDHRVCDAYSFNMFLVAWAAAARGGGPAPPAPSFRRSLVAPRDPPPRAAASTGALIDRLFSPRSAAPPPPPAAAVAVNRIYRVAAADIAALKAAAGPGRTKLEAFTAHLWQLCSRAASSPRQSQCCMGVVVDGRTRMSPDGAMRAYFGNVLTIPYGVIGSEDLRRMDLAEVADDVHRWVAEAATGDHFRGLVDWVEALRPKPAAARAYLGGTGGDEAMACIVSSGMTFPVRQADFGTGLPAFASYHFPWPAGAGYVMPMPSARGDGDWVVYVHVAPELAKVMEEEPTVFRALENSYVFQ
ncbi:hypothetical protein U9M48_033746 [Paspalum notatum var. saurae]|uniref:Uncharacterized protein n=1 Tax=Paspalum notatum var. saurae TaxID=547442 RepID=A0AAQ3UC40_PASNO